MVDVLTGSAFDTPRRMHHREDEVALEFPSSAGSRVRNLVGLKCQNWRASGGAPKPYDAEVEYLETFGAQWIDTGITPNTETALEMSLDLTYVDASYRAFCASRTSNRSDDQFSFVFYNSGGYCGFGDQEKGLGGEKHAGEKFRNLAMSKSGVSYDWEYDGSSGTTSVEFSVRTVTSSLNLYLFGRNTAGTASNFAYCKMHYCKLTKNGSLVRDFIPVRVGQVGYMYDRVSRQLFGNSGTGAFVVGPDI